MKPKLASLSLLLAILSGCGKAGPKPSDADIAAYLAQAQPSYLRISQVAATHEPARDLAGIKFPDGAWRVHVTYTLHASQDLFAPTEAGRAQREAFDMAVAQAEQFRVARIAGVAQLGRQAGLIAPGGSVPEPAMPVGLVTHKDQDLADAVTLLAQPDGHGWKFFQLDAQKLSDAEVGAPLDQLRRASPSTVFVETGSDEERSFRARSQRFLEILAKVPQP